MPKDMMIYGVIVLLILWIIIEQRLLVTSKYTIRSEKLSRKSGAVSFVVLADLHNCELGKRNRRLLRKVEALAPDFVLVAGDMVNKTGISYPGKASLLMEDLAKKYRVFYAYGNHEQRLEQKEKKDGQPWTEEELSSRAAWMEFKNRMKEAQVKILDNESVMLESESGCLRFTGVSIEEKYFGFHAFQDMEVSYLNSVLGESNPPGMPKECFQILIAHNPVFFDTYARWGAELTLSGHVHGGMMRLPGLGGVLSPQARFFPKYDAGHYVIHGRSGEGSGESKGASGHGVRYRERRDSRNQAGMKHMVVSRGLGSHSIMPRIFNIPELVYIRLTGEE
ncbi:hypothetical protein HNQ56_002424 [Anaerotaenia torta]|uniref:metallophosphoesterase n=1 Tax=Anaerotaenia torta TaxID=433293 RepID=UPI003D21695E